MIDMLVLRCPIRDKIEISYDSKGVPSFKDTTDFLTIDQLEVPLQCSITPQGETFGLRHAWESIPSSYASLAFKIFDYRESKDPEFYVEIKASPAKIMQGHNIYGSDKLGECAYALIDLLCETYPHLSNYLDHKNWSVHQIDITYHSWAKNEHEAKQFINALANVSSGQTKGRKAYDGTAYFGKKNSRIKKIKVYDKYNEVLNFIASETRKGDPNQLLHVYTDELINWCKGMVRWESSIKTRWLQRRNIPNNLYDLIQYFNAQNFWNEAMKDIFKSLQGEQFKIIKDSNIKKKLETKFPTVSAKTGKITFGKAHAAYRTFRAIKADGFMEAQSTISKPTFYRHLTMLHDIGLSKALLQNLRGEGLKCEVIPLIRYVEVNFEQQYPPFYQPLAA